MQVVTFETNSKEYHGSLLKYTCEVNGVQVELPSNTLGILRHITSLVNRLYDMDYHFQRISGECGFKLWDKVINENISPSVAIGLNNKYNRGYVVKVHETTLIWFK